MQNQEVLERMGKFTGITSILAIPMEDMPVSKLPPVNKQVVIGTPGTINKWFTARKLGMSAMNILVFDEADHMLAEVILIYDPIYKVMHIYVNTSRSSGILFLFATLIILICITPHVICPIPIWNLLINDVGI